MTEVDVGLPHPVGQPVMLIQADARREGKIRAHAYKHSPPTCIVEIDVVLVHPEVCNLEMPAIVLLVPVGKQDPR